ncbi:MAG TPA: carbohydrate kinase family protein [Roseiflexaceae bacterium]
MSILVVGDANADLSAAVNRFPHEGDDLPIAALEWGSGGSGANVATALALLGAPVQLLARVGRDPAAEVALRVARAAGVNLDAVQRDDSLATGLCFAAISPGGERTFFSYRGANVNLDLGSGVKALVNDAAWLHIAGHALLEGAQRDAIDWLRAEAADHPNSISLDLCLPLLRERREEILKLLPSISVLFANEIELDSLFPGVAYAAALEQAIRSNVHLAVLKLGPRGCLIVGDGLRHAAPAFPIEAIDTNACGDAFVAGFLHAHLRGEPPDACAVLANAMGALTATRHGAAEALPDRTRLRALLADHPIARLLAYERTPG